MTDYDYWLNHDKWNSEQAALIFNDKDQRLCGKQIKFPAGDNNFSGVKPNAWQWKVLEYYFIFEKADWEKYADTKSDCYFYFHHPREASPSDFISLAQDKQLDVPGELLRKFEKIISRGKEPEKQDSTSINEQRANILKKWLANRNLSNSTPLEMTRKELWDKLSAIDGEAFSYKSKYTINEFFASQNYCTFKRGRRKEG
jgi:hypothetical protein